MNHSDIRGLGPHDHGSSGAASLQEREFETEVLYRIELPRVLLYDVGRSDLGQGRPDEAGELAGDGGDDVLFGFAPRGEALIAAMQAVLRGPRPGDDGIRCAPLALT